MKKLLLGLALALAPLSASAQVAQPTAIVVTTCGSPSPAAAFVAGRSAPLTVDVNGKLCLTGGGGGVTNPLTLTRLLTITQGTANEGILASTGYSLTGSNATNMIDLAGAWNTSGAPTALKVAMTNTASGSALLANFLAGAGGVTSEWSVSKAGAVIQGSDLTLGNNTNGYQFSTATATQLRLLDSSGSTWKQIGVYAIGIDSGNTGQIKYGSTGAETPVTFITFPKFSTALVQFGDADAASPVAQTLSVQSVIAGTSNIAGVNETIVGSLSTGSGASGDIIFQTGGTGAGATAQNAATTALTIKGATQAVVAANTIAGKSLISSGAVPTLALAGGTCAGTVIAGGPTAGTVTLTAACATTNTMTLTVMPTAPVGYACDAVDRTLGTVILAQSATTTTGATFKFSGTTGATDVIAYKCIAY